MSSGDYRNGKGRSKIGVVLRSLDLFSNKAPYSELKVGINVYLQDYLNLYPNDEEYLLRTMEIEREDINLEP